MRSYRCVLRGGVPVSKPVALGLIIGVTFPPAIPLLLFIACVVFLCTVVAWGWP
jgi:hypothetical protein